MPSEFGEMEKICPSEKLVKNENLIFNKNCYLEIFEYFQILTIKILNQKISKFFHISNIHLGLENPSLIYREIFVIFCSIIFTRISQSN
jgi:hypothetical protein